MLKQPPSKAPNAWQNDASTSSTTCRSGARALGTSTSRGFSSDSSPTTGTSRSSTITAAPTTTRVVVVRNYRWMILLLGAVLASVQVATYNDKIAVGDVTYFVDVPTTNNELEAILGRDVVIDSTRENPGQGGGEEEKEKEKEAARQPTTNTDNKAEGIRKGHKERNNRASLQITNQQPRQQQQETPQQPATTSATTTIPTKRKLAPMQAPTTAAATAAARSSPDLDLKKEEDLKQEHHEDEDPTVAIKPVQPTTTKQQPASYYKDRLMKEFATFESQSLLVLTTRQKQQDDDSQQQKAPLQRLPDYIKGTYQHPERDVTLAAHMSVDKQKLKRLGTLHRFWRGPISLAIRITSKKHIQLFFQYYSQLPPSITNSWTVHFLLEYIKPFKSDSFAAQYSHNILRNMALHSPAIPDYVLGVDLDFVPTYGAYPKLMQMLQYHPYLWDKMRTNKKLLVLPVMEVLHIPDSWDIKTPTALVERLHSLQLSSQQYRGLLTQLNHTLSEPQNQDLISLPAAKNKTIMALLREGNRTLIREANKRGSLVDPATLDELLDADSNRVQLITNMRKLKVFGKGDEMDLPKSREELKQMYRYELARPWHNHLSHLSTDLNQYWHGNYTGNFEGGQNTNMTYPITKPDTKYEPYFIGYKPELPQYWEAFRGFGLNKQSFVRECLLMGFQMEALYEFYLTHLAHKSNMNRDIKSINKKEWDTQFQPYLERKYRRKPQWLKGDQWYRDPTKT